MLFYVALAMAFAGFVAVTFGHHYASQFLAGYITEYSLSVDNLFVFMVIMSSFAVPEDHRHRVLTIGIVIALILRGILIVLGAAAIQRFAATFFVFGAFLLYTAITVWRSGDEEADPDGNALVRFVERRVPTTREYHGTKLSVVLDTGQRVITPMALVMLAIGTTDLLFALDSIPAVFGLTQEPYLVFTANAFALMGLRQLYFMLDGLLDRVDLPVEGPGAHPRLHLDQADLPRPARDDGPARARDLHLGLAGGDHQRPGRHDDRQSHRGASRPVAGPDRP